MKSPHHSTVLSVPVLVILTNAASLAQFPTVPNANGTATPQQIVFWSNRTPPEGGYHEDIYRADVIKTVDGKDTLVNVSRLTTSTDQSLEPSWSPDGSQIVFSRVGSATRRWAIWKMNTNGQNQVELTSALVERAIRADWHSNGKIVVAYTDSNETQAGIGWLDPHATIFTPIYTVGARASAPASPNPTWPKWSPQGTRIAFLETKDGNEEIYVINADGSGLVNVTNSPAHETQPFWTSDETVMFMSNRDNGNLDLYEIDLTTLEVTRITTDPGHELDAVSSPDGSQILFAHDLASFFSPQLYTMASDGSSWVQLTFVGANRYPAWRPNLSTDIHQSSGLIPSAFRLFQNFPNPFNPSTLIRFSLSQPEHVTLRVFNLLGEQVAVLVSERLSAGVHETQWRAGHLPSGIYFYQLHAGPSTETKKLNLLR